MNIRQNFICEYVIYINVTYACYYIYACTYRYVYVCVLNLFKIIAMPLGHFIQNNSC